MDDQRINYTPIFIYYNKVILLTGIEIEFALVQRVYKYNIILRNM